MATRHTSNESFNQLLLEAIDEALSSFGENVKISIFFHLETQFKLMKQEIPAQIGYFSFALEQIFGPGARHLEILFMKKLHSKIGSGSKALTTELSIPEITFKNYVNLMKKNYEDKMNQEKMEFLINEDPEQHLCKSL